MHDDGTDSRIKIFANIFISFIGAGILGLPYAFKEVSQCPVLLVSVVEAFLLGQSGIVEGAVVMTIVGAMR